MKRRREQERDEEIAREQADARREALLAELRAHQTAAPAPEPPVPEAPAEPTADADAESEEPTPEEPDES